MKKEIMKREKKKVLLKSILIFVVLVFVLLFCYSVYAYCFCHGRVFEGKVYQVSGESVDFLYDLTYENEKGGIVYEHEIFDKVFEIIDNAENFIIIDMFLFGASEKKVYRNLAEELTNHLIDKKRDNPDIEIYFITDYFNVIKKYDKGDLKKLNEKGIEIVYSSPPYGKMYFGEKSFLNYFFKLFKKKLNHKKFIVADNTGEIVSLVTSANPHDDSSANSNTGIYIEEKIWKDIYEFERKDNLIPEIDFVEDFIEAGKNFNKEKVKDDFYELDNLDSENVFVQFLGDGGLMESVVREIDETEKGESIEIIIFYLSDKKVIRSLISASERGVDIKIVLDINVESFGKKKEGVPNQPVAEKLIKDSEGRIKIKWYKTHGEQFHVKMVVIKKKNGKVIVFLGSSNLTNNQVINYNFQADVMVVGFLNSFFVLDADDFFKRIWNNENGIYSGDYEEFKDNFFKKNLKYEAGQIIKRVF